MLVFEARGSASRARAGGTSAVFSQVFCEVFSPGRAKPVSAQATAVDKGVCYRRLLPRTALTSSLRRIKTVQPYEGGASQARICSWA